MKPDCCEHRNAFLNDDMLECPDCTLKWAVFYYPQKDRIVKEKFDQSDSASIGHRTPRLCENITLRQFIWIEAWKAASKSMACHNVKDVADWADDALDRFDKRFSEQRKSPGGADRGDSRSMRPLLRANSFI